MRRERAERANHDYGAVRRRRAQRGGVVTELDVWSVDARTGERVEAVAAAATPADVDAAALRSAEVAAAQVGVRSHGGHRLNWEVWAAALGRAAGSVALPEDVLQVIHGRDGGTHLVRHPAIQAVGFTGSVGGGRALYDLAVSRPVPIPFYG